MSHYFIFLCVLVCVDRETSYWICHRWDQSLVAKSFDQERNGIPLCDYNTGLKAGTHTHTHLNMYTLTSSKFNFFLIIYFHLLRIGLKPFKMCVFIFILNHFVKLLFGQCWNLLNHPWYQSFSKRACNNWVSFSDLESLAGL